MTMLFDTHYYRIVKLFSSIVGLWPYQTQLKNRIIRSIHIFILFSYMPPQLNRLYYVWGKDIDAVCMCLTPILTIVLSLSKSMIFIRFEPEVSMLLRQIEMDWKVTTKVEEYKILVDYMSKARKYCIIYSALLCNMSMLFIITPTISPLLDIVLPRNETRIRSLNFDLDYGLDLQTYWLWLWMHTCTTSGATIINIIGADLMYITLVIYSCYLFAITRYKLDHVADSFKNHTARSFANYHNIEYRTYQSEDQLLKLKEQVVIRECVISHEKAIKCAQLLHRIYSWGHFVALGLNLIMISISGIQVVSKLHQWTEVGMSTLYVIGQLTHLLFLCLMAQFILNQSLNVYESAYLCSWYNMPVKLQRDIIFILMRSSIPCKIVAGKLFVMSLENFCTILQTSMSYFTVLASFR